MTTQENMDMAAEVVDGLGAKQPTPTPGEPKHAKKDEADTFDRAYVEELRRESAKYRTRAGEAETLAQRLHTQLVKASGKLQDPSDLAFDAAHLDNEEALEEAIDALLEAKPHLKARRVSGDVGAGTRGTASNETDLIGLIRSLS